LPPFRRLGVELRLLGSTLVRASDERVKF